MTRDELDSATDEQLNVMAAKVMGWTKFDYVFERKMVNGYTFYCDQLHKSDGVDIFPWSPATDIADAWELVEKMRVLYGFNLDASGFDGAEWRVVIGWGDDPISVHVEAATAPRAITTAALLAWGEKENSK